jgi:hypothetical protein
VLLAEVEVRAWNNDRMLRHTSFKGPGDEADEASIFRILDWLFYEPSASPARVKSRGALFGNQEDVAVGHLLEYYS